MARGRKSDPISKVKKGRVTKSKRKSRSSLASRPSPTSADTSYVTEESVEDTIGEIDDTLNPNPGAKPTYSHLRPKKKYFPEDQIHAEWKRLKPPAQEKVRELFTTIKRQVVSTIGAGKEKKMLEAEESLESFMRKLIGKVPVMPFPPKTKEINFDLEKLTDQSRSLESQLTASLHSVALLKAEIAREETQLEMAHKHLEELERNAESERRFWQSQGKKMHPLLDFGELNESREDGPEQIGFAVSSDNNRSIFDTEDPDLAPLLSQLHNHLESIHGNSRQVDGIEDAFTSASVVLEGFVNQRIAQKSGG